MNRKCKQCQQLKDLTKDNFYQDANRKGGFQYTCKPCKNKRTKDLRPNWNSTHQTIERVERNKQYVVSVFELNPCQSCNESDNSCLDFHHIDPKTKEYPISRMVYSGMALEVIIAEIKKCCSVCSNCHRKYHRGRINFTPHNVILPK